MTVKLQMGCGFVVDKKELIEKLRAAKIVKHLSCQEIVDITEQNGEAVSMSTVRRVFGKDSNANDFRYKQTLWPIARAVLGIDEELHPPETRPTIEQAEQDYTTIEALKALVDFKSEMLARAEKEIELLRAEIEKRDRIIEKKDAVIEWLSGIG